jgi:hypothetical protein
MPETGVRIPVAVLLVAVVEVGLDHAHGQSGTRPARVRPGNDVVLRDIGLRLATGFGLDRIEPCVQWGKVQDAGNRSALDSCDLSREAIVDQHLLAYLETWGLDVHSLVQLCRRSRR